MHSCKIILLSNNVHSLDIDTKVEAVQSRMLRELLNLSMMGGFQFLTVPTRTARKTHAPTTGLGKVALLP